LRGAGGRAAAMGAGEGWRQKRESLGKTLEDVSQELRVSRRYLQGIETADYAKWPPKVFSAGFIRAYARLLGEDPEPVLSEYYAFLTTLSPGQASSPGMPRPQWIERERRRGTRRAGYWAAAAAVLAAGILLSLLSMRTAPRPVPGPEPPHASRAEPFARPAAEDNQAVAPAPATGAEAPPRQDPPVESLPAEEGAGKIGPMRLLLEANDLTWVMYSRDGGDPVDVMLFPGDRFRIEARKSLYLKLGNAGGVAASLNGKALPPFGRRGEVKEVRLGE
jgi:cytoskeleton protein RodZ